MSISDISITSDKNEPLVFLDYVHPLDYLALNWVGGVFCLGAIFGRGSHSIVRLTMAVSGIALATFSMKEFYKAIDKIYDRSTRTWKPSNVGKDIRESIKNILKPFKEKLSILRFYR